MILQERVESVWLFMIKKFDFLMKNFYLLNYKAQVSFNQLIEEIIGLLFQISCILLKSYRNDPDQIGVINMNYLLKVSEFVIKEREIIALSENIELYQDVGDLVEESIDAYVLFSKNPKDSIPLSNDEVVVF